VGTGKAIEGFSDDAMAALVRYDFPGNIRELENLVERAFILCDAPLISPEHLPPRISKGPVSLRANGDSIPGLESLERKAIRDALARHDGNRSRAARDLGVHRTTLIRKIKRFGLTAPVQTGS
jgi:DNA-binding NtrC family response regulator